MICKVSLNVEFPYGNSKVEIKDHIIPMRAIYLSDDGGERS